MSGILTLRGDELLRDVVTLEGGRDCLHLWLAIKSYILSSSFTPSLPH